ncbi:MAG: hypothetical protein J6Y77_03275 [Paludibacteraceae bacterium]|nr:hypothetical protein [Paludibacteraceae bacterium]
MKGISKYDWVFAVSALLMLGGAVGYMWNHEAGAICYTVGLVPMCWARIQTRYTGNDSRQKHLTLLLMLALACYIVSAWLMYTGRNWWVLLLLYASVTELVIAWRRPADQTGGKKAEE